MNPHELCGKCAHAFDHIGKQCQHAMPNGAPCPCKNAVRTDVLMCRQQVEMLNRLESLFLLLAFIHRIEITEAGEFRRVPNLELTH